MRSGSSRLAGNFVGVLCMLLWATNFPLADRLLADWHPVLLTPVRSGMAALALVFVVICMGQWRQLFALKVRHLVGAGGVALAASNLMFVWGQRYVDPATAAILVSAMPIVSVVMGVVTRVERLTVVLAAGIVLAAAGGAIASIGLQDGASGSREGSYLGAIVIATGVVFYVWYSRSMVAVSPQVSPLAKAAISMVMLTLMTLIYAEFAVLFGLVPLEYDLSGPSLLMLAWLGPISIGASTVLWFLAGKMVGITIASMHHNLVPLYVMVIMLLLGGSIEVLTLAGAGLVIAGAALAQLPSLDIPKIRKVRVS